MSLNDMTPEQMEKAQACKTSEELAEFAQSIGITLSEEELEGVAGGGGFIAGGSDFIAGGSVWKPCPAGRARNGTQPACPLCNRGALDSSA